VNGMPPIALVTVLFNSRPILPAFVESLNAQTYENWRLIAIDNASSDDGADYLKGLRHPKIEVIENDENLGVAAANNQGIARALSDRNVDWIGVINNDVTFLPDCFESLLKSASSKGAKFVSPQIVYAEDRDRIWYAGGSLKRWPIIDNSHWDMEKSLQKTNPTSQWVSYAPTCFLFVQRDVFLDVGLMWEPYFVYNDDVDFIFRAAARGYRIWMETNVTIDHYVGFSSGGGLSRFSLYYGSRNAVLLMRRNLPELLWRIQYGFLWVKYRATASLKRKAAYILEAQIEGLRDGLRAEAR